MPRRQRQLDEMRALCAAGAVARAIDLAFEHFAHFGRDEEVIALLSAAVERADIAQQARARLAALCASHT